MANLIKGLLAKALPFDATRGVVGPDGAGRHVRCGGLPVTKNQSPKNYIGSHLTLRSRKS